MTQLTLDDVVRVIVAPDSPNRFTYFGVITAWCGKTDGPGLYWYTEPGGRIVWHCGHHGFEDRPHKSPQPVTIQARM